MYMFPLNTAFYDRCAGDVVLVCNYFSTMLQIFEADGEVYDVVRKLVEVDRIPHFRNDDFWVLMAASFMGWWVTDVVPFDASADQKRKWREEVRHWMRDKLQARAQGKEPPLPPFRCIILNIPESFCSCTKDCPNGR